MNAGAASSVDPSAEDQDDRVRVLYIVGWGRSGSTLLQRVLGQVEGWADCGEVADLWERGALDGGRCGCGAVFDECPFWSAVLERTFCGRPIDADRFASARFALRLRPSPAMALPGDWDRLVADLGDYPEVVDSVYRSIRDTSDADVVIDSSKDPRYARLLADSAAIDLSLVHLVRDPRATAWSWQRTLDDPGRAASWPRVDPVRSSLLWDASNILAERLGRGPNTHYLRVRYEDFVADPFTTVRRIIDLMGSNAPVPEGLQDKAIELRPTHSVWGNPNRFSTGLTHFRSDDEWFAKMPPRQRALVMALTFPLAFRYRYAHRSD